MPLRQYQELIGWKKAGALVAHIYRHTQSCPKDEMYGLMSQLRRAAVSIPSNIEEGQADSPVASSSTSSATHAAPLSK
jgi:four helix bundle protein